MRSATWFILAIAGSVLSGCQSDQRTLDEDARVIASVNQQVVTVSWFETTYINFLVRSGGNDTIENRTIHLDNMIDAILVSDLAESTDLIKSVDYQTYKLRKEKSAVGGRYFEETFLRSLPPPTEAEIRETFIRWKDKVIVRHLYYTDPVEAGAAYQRLLEGRPFIDEAQDCYGLTAFDSLAGYLGQISYFNSDDSFAETAFEMEAGTFSEPVRSRFGYHIIKVEDRIIEPLLTESEFSVRRQGLSSQFRLRKRRIEGDKFVRDFMIARNVSVDAQAIAALQSLLRDFAIDVQPRTEVLPPAEARFNMDSLRQALNPETILAHYEFGGREYDFTAGDYQFWLEDLPFQEALHRTAASIGRAMRNELLWMAGDEEGLFDEKAKGLVERELIYRKSKLLREQLRSDPTTEIDSSLIRESFMRAGLGEARQNSFDFIAVPFRTRQMAEQAAESVRTGTTELIDYPGVIAGVDQTMDAYPDWRQAASTATLNTPVVTGLVSGWGVIRVSRRTRLDLNWEEHKNDIVERLRPFAAEYTLVKFLREKADIEIDTLLFKQIMILNGSEPSAR